MFKHKSKEEQHINVSVRIRPNDKENEFKVSPFLEVLSRKELLTRTIYNQKRYVFDRIFDGESTQLEIYDAIVSPLIPEVIDGYNCTVFAYGQTGTGKTYTMEGIQNIDCQINAGIIPRSLAQIFRVLDSVNTESSVKVSYLELYNEELFDLLCQESTPKAIKIYEDKSQKGSVILQGLEELSVTNFNQVYKILEHGTERRRIASTFLNSTSSRSHTVFTIVVHLREITVDGEELVKTGKLNLVDLAGSENISKSGAIDKRAREAGSINQSLLTLGRVIKALAEKSTHIPYRESKLTRILQDSLGGHTKTSLIATISSTTANHEETLNTLEYAMRARCIQNKPEVNQKISRTALINQYSDTIEKLQRDLVAVRTGTGFFVDETNYTKLVAETEVQRAELLEKINYIKKLEDSLSDHTESLRILKASWAEAANNMEQLSNAKRILQKDLILVKEINKQKEQELQLVKEKHEHLTDETEKLLSDIQIHSLNEEVFHKKVSYLYQTSQMNRNITEMFYNMHNKLNTKVMYHIDNCINTTLKLMIAQETTWSQNNPQLVFNQLIGNVDYLQQVLNSMQNYQIEYLENKETLKNRYASYSKTLQRIIKNMNERSYTFRNEFSNRLVRLRDDINHKADENITDFKYIMTELLNIRNMATNEVTSISNILQQFHTNVMENIDELTNRVRELDQKQNESCNTISDIQQEIEQGQMEYAKFMEKCSSRLSNYKTQYQEVLHINSDLIKKIESFKENTHNSLEVLATGVTKLDTLQKADNAFISSLNTFNDQVDLNKKKANGCIMDTERDFKENFVCFEDEAMELLKHENKKCEVEITEDMRYAELGNVICDAENTVESIKVDIHSVADKYKTWNDEFLNKSNEIKSTIENDHKICSDTSENIKRLVDDFCGCQLKYPTSAGDTPQKVQPKSNLYKNTLTKNCFKDDEKNTCRVKNANKENSSTAMNVGNDHT